MRARSNRGSAAVKTMKPADVAPFILDAAATAHERKPFVGGFFNAYEAAVTWELFNAALNRGLWNTGQEMPLGQGQTTCDLVLPLSEGKRLWLEVKMWWFLMNAYRRPYAVQSKTRSWPWTDWMRLPQDRKNHRAVLLVRTWDDGQGAKAKAGDWLVQLAEMMADQRGATKYAKHPLKSFTYQGDQKHTRHGDLILWSSTLV
jgi:hypothetical protein